MFSTCPSRPLYGWWSLELVLGFPGGTSDKEPAHQCKRRKRLGFDPWVGQIPWRRKQQPTPVFLPKNPMDRGAWLAMVHGVTKSQTQLKQLSTHAHDLFWPMSCEWDWHTVWAGAFHCQFETLFRPFPSATATGIISETACLVS